MSGYCPECGNTLCLCDALAAQEQMTKTIPVISGREFWIEFGGDPSKDGELYKRYCSSHEFKPATYAEEVIHCAEVTGSIQLDDLRSIIESGETAIMFRDNCFVVNEFQAVLNDFKTKYSNLLKGSE